MVFLQNFSIILHCRCDNLNQETVKGQIVFDELKVQDNIPIYNFISSVELPVTWGKSTGFICKNELYLVPYNFRRNEEP